MDFSQIFENIRNITWTGDVDQKQPNIGCNIRDSGWFQPQYQEVTKMSTGCRTFTSVKYTLSSFSLLTK